MGSKKITTVRCRDGLALIVVHTRRALKTSRKPFHRIYGGTVAPNLANRFCMSDGCDDRYTSIKLSLYTQLIKTQK